MNQRNIKLTLKTVTQEITGLLRLYPLTCWAVNKGTRTFRSSVYLVGWIFIEHLRGEDIGIVITGFTGSWMPQDKEGIHGYFSVRNECRAEHADVCLYLLVSSLLGSGSSGSVQPLERAKTEAAHKPIRLFLGTISQVGPKWSRLSWLRK